MCSTARLWPQLARAVSQALIDAALRAVADKPWSAHRGVRRQARRSAADIHELHSKHNTIFIYHAYYIHYYYTSNQTWNISLQPNAHAWIYTTPSFPRVARLNLRPSPLSVSVWIVCLLAV